MLWVLWADDATLCDGDKPTWAHDLEFALSVNKGIFAIVTPAPRDILHSIEDTLGEFDLPPATFSITDADAEHPDRAIRNLVERTSYFFPGLEVSGVVVPETIRRRLNIDEKKVQVIVTSDRDSSDIIAEVVTDREKGGMRGYWKVGLGKSSNGRNEFDPITIG